jgi:hypothetical protein
MPMNDRSAYSCPERRVAAWAAQRRWPIALAAAAAVTDLAVTAAGTTHSWGLSGSPATVEAWCAATLAVVLIVAATCRQPWFHPLSLPLAVVAVMSLAAPLWVWVTHEPANLLYSPGYEPPGQPLAAALSATACAALVLVVAGYLAGAAATLAVSRTTAPPAAKPVFRYRDMRSGGFALLCAGAIPQAVLTIVSAGKTYGADQLQYGLTSFLAAAAAMGMLAGLAVVTMAAAHTARATRLRDLLRGREWAALGLYMAAVAASGQRAGLIAPGVYLAWVYSTRVRAIPRRWAVAALLLVLWGGAVIAHHRADGGLSPGSPAAVAASAAGDLNSPAWLTQQTVMHVPSGTPYLHGSTYLAAAEAQLPGPASRHLGATSRTASAVFRDIIGFYDPNQGFSESYPSEAFLNFGLPGCLGAGLFLGALMGWAWRKRGEVAARPRDLLYPVLLAGLVYGFRSDALTQVKDVLYPMLIVWAMMAWCRMPTSVQSHPLRTTASCDISVCDQP